MIKRRPTWTRLIASGVPDLFVLRPMGGGYTPPTFGDIYPTPSTRVEMNKARQMYEMKRIGTVEDVEIALGSKKGEHVFFSICTANG